MIFAMQQVGINEQLSVFQRLQIALMLYQLMHFLKFLNDLLVLFFFELALEIIWLP